MKNKSDIVVIIILSLIACIVFSAFIYGIVTRTNESVPFDSATFDIVSNGDDFKIVYNRLTKVMYSVSDGTNNSGVFTVLVNPDGTPMLWEY